MKKLKKGIWDNNIILRTKELLTTDCIQIFQFKSHLPTTRLFFAKAWLESLRRNRGRKFLSTAI